MHTGMKLVPECTSLTGADFMPGTPTAVSRQSCWTQLETATGIGAAKCNPYAQYTSQITMFAVVHVQVVYGSHPANAVQQRLHRAAAQARWDCQQKALTSRTSEWYVHQPRPAIQHAHDQGKY